MQQDPIGEIVVVYEDDRILAVSKPNRLLVHRSKLDYYEPRNLLNELSAMTGLHLHPAHRLDKATSGVMLLAKDAETLSRLRESFNARVVEKVYVALVRGYTPATGTIDAVVEGVTDGKEREAVTRFTTLYHVEVPIEVSRYSTSRYSMVEARPITGRYHQIRVHFDKIRHPIIGDSRHGDRKHNHMFKEHLHQEALFLHAREITFPHPSGGTLTVSAPLPDHFAQIKAKWAWNEGAHPEAAEPGNHNK